MDVLVDFKNELLGRTAKVNDPSTWLRPAHSSVVGSHPRDGHLVDLMDPMLWVCVGSILFNPIFWNSVARNEYRNKTLTKIFGSPKRGTYFLAVVIFSLGIIRDYIYKEALARQPSSGLLASPLVQLLGMMSFVGGQILVLTSIYALGITGTYLGDYFGILMQSRVTGFPFNLMEDPMYNGSTMCFLGTAIWYKSPAGLLLSALVFVVYRIALTYEGPFTGDIYSSAAAKKSSAVASTSKRSTAPIPASSGKSTVTSISSSAHSYAEAAAHAPSRSGLPNTDPKPVPIVQSATSEGEASGTNGGRGAPSPKGAARRVTRSRSRAKLVED